MEKLITLGTIVQYNIIYLIIGLFLLLFIYRKKFIFTYYYLLGISLFIVFIVISINILIHFYNFSGYELGAIGMILYGGGSIIFLLFIACFIYDLGNDKIFSFKFSKIETFLLTLSLIFIGIFIIKVCYYQIYSQQIINLGYGYKIQGNNAYFVNNYIDGSSGNTFEILNEYLAKDDKNIYFYGDKVSGVTIENFLYLGGGYYKNNMGVYYNNKSIQNADIESFIYLSGSQAKDKNQYYLNGKILKK